MQQGKQMVHSSNKHQSVQTLRHNKIYCSSTSLPHKSEHYSRGHSISSLLQPLCFHDDLRGRLEPAGSVKQAMLNFLNPHTVKAQKYRACTSSLNPELQVVLHNDHFVNIYSDSDLLGA